MSKAKPTAIQIATVLDRTVTLIQQLKAEPWSEYDPVLQKALLNIMTKGFAHYQVVAKAIVNVEPTDTRSQPGPGAPWFDSALDGEDRR